LRDDLRGKALARGESGGGTFERFWVPKIGGKPNKQKG